MLGDSRRVAVAALLSMEKKFARNPALFEQYKKFIDEYLSLDHMVLANDVAKTPNETYYMPHHAVFQESTTTKLRVVFNASQKTTNGKSLNDLLAVGPKLQDDLYVLLLRARKYKVILSADIEKMYRQIVVSEDQLNLQRILWRSNPNEKIRDYVLRTVTYGTANAPYLAVRVLHQLAMVEKERFPIAAEIIKNDFYMDDLMCGADNLGMRSRFIDNCEQP